MTVCDRGVGIGRVKWLGTVGAHTERRDRRDCEGDTEDDNDSAVRWVLS